MKSGDIPTFRVNISPTFSRSKSKLPFCLCCFFVWLTFRPWTRWRYALTKRQAASELHCIQHRRLLTAFRNYNPSTHSSVSWYVTSCSLVEIYGGCGDTYCQAGNSLSLDPEDRGSNSLGNVDTLYQTVRRYNPSILYLLLTVASFKTSKSIATSQSVFFTRCKRSSHTPVRNHRQNFCVVYPDYMWAGIAQSV
jgi:hypothetical protein